MRDSNIADKKYWKISRVVEVITSENIEFITCGLPPLMITSTTRDIFQYFLSAIWESLIRQCLTPIYGHEPKIERKSHLKYCSNHKM